MLELIQLIEKLAPETLEVLKERYRILRMISVSSPIGRRLLADKLGMTERVLRTEVDILRKQYLVQSTKSGMVLTPAGEKIIPELEQVFGHILGMKDKETTLARYLGIEQCIIVSGNTDETPVLLDHLGDSVVNLLDQVLPEGRNVIAVMGGTTMAAVAERMSEQLRENRELLFVPARGGVGERVAIQSNSISAVMAQKTGGKHRVLYAPEHVRSQTYSLLLEEPEIKETMNLLKQANCVLLGIGDAMHMAQRRGLSAQLIKELRDKGAVAEAFGEFVDKDGNIIYKIPRIGLKSDSLKDVPNVIAVAAGKHKARAIEAYLRQAPSHLRLVTDEGAANEILKGISL